jgi:hypothetical protein
MLGHTSAKMTLDTYADLFDDDLDAVAVTLHSRYSLEVTRKCGHEAAREVASKHGNFHLAEKMPLQNLCGRRDSNPHALSSTGT